MRVGIHSKRKKEATAATEGGFRVKRKCSFVGILCLSLMKIENTKHG